MGALTIYKASAGSGKTYTLTREYLKLMLSQPGSFRNILAVTFTNKATAEMKARILRDLSKIAAGEAGGLEKELCAHLDCTSAGLRANATRELYLLLHDYTHFSVQTIDSFFQRIIRSFARETGLLEGFQIELDTQRVLQESIRDMVAHVGENAELMAWLSEMAFARLREGNGWNFSDSLQKLGSELFIEALQDHESHPSHPTLFRREELQELKEVLQKQQNQLEREIKRLGSLGVAYFEQNGLQPAQFTQGVRGPAGHFYKCRDKGFEEPNSYVLKAHFDSEAWCTKKCEKRELLMQHVEGSLHGLLLDVVDFFDRHIVEYQTADAVLKFLPAAGVLADISKSLAEYAAHENLFLLARSAAFIQHIIRDADTPFIYEKMGEYYRNFMIDEFQDTSRLQWANFMPLVTNALASGNTSLIVGDVKQAIYRWRDTDWKLLASEAAKDVAPMPVRFDTLRHNWRSDGRVVGFNNRFFGSASGLLEKYLLDGFPESAGSELRQQLSSLLESAYSDVFQELPETSPHKERGYVQIEFVEEDPEKDADSGILERLPPLLASLQARGVALRDIAILVRKKEQAFQITQSLQKAALEWPDRSVRFDILSNESLLLQSSPAVNWLVSAMQWLINRDDAVNEAFLRKEYQHYFREEGNEEIEVDPGARLRALAGQLQALPLYELCSLLISEFRLSAIEGQWPYIQAFLDVVVDYSRRNGSGIAPFLDQWEQKKESLSVKLSDRLDAIRLLTIHKAKGLEFKVVIVPFCHWKLDDNLGRDILWVQPPGEPYTRLKMLPVKYENQLRSTLFVKAFYEEQMMNFVDSLNLLYVALTRACSELYVMAEAPKSQAKDQAKTVAHLLAEALVTVPDFNEQYLSGEPFCWGAPLVPTQGGEARASEEPVYCREPRPGDCPSKPIFHLLRKSRLYMADFQPGRKEMGTLLHALFCKIETFDGIDTVLQAWREEGILESAQIEQLRILLEQASRNGQVADWFSGRYRVRTESDLLLPGGGGQRPDRIMTKGSEAIVIDYKFGEKILPAYRRQVGGYCNTLREMGFESVRGYIWYVLADTLEEVS